MNEGNEKARKEIISVDNQNIKSYQISYYEEQNRQQQKNGEADTDAQGSEVTEGSGKKVQLAEVDQMVENSGR